MRKKSLPLWRQKLKKVEKFGRRCLNGSLAFLLRARRQYATIPPQDIQRILLFKMDERLGNMIILSSFLEMVRKTFPQAEITYWAANKMTSMVAANPAVTAVFPFVKWTFSPSKSWPAVLHALRKKHFDLAIDCSHPITCSTTHAMLTRLAGARYTIGADRGTLAPYYTSPVLIPSGVKAEREQYPYLLQPFGVDPARVPPLHFFPTKELAACSAAVKAALGQVPAVIVNMGAGTKDRFLDRRLIGRILDYLENRGCQTLVTWGPAEEPLAKAVVQPDYKSVKMAPPTDVNELYYLMAAARLVISGDTGPMHLAVASGTPTLALFIKGQPERFGHNYPPHKVLLLRGTEDDWLSIKGYCDTILK